MRQELRALSRDSSHRVTRHLVAALVSIEDDPETAVRHAEFAGRLGARIGVVREIHGIIAYRAGDYRTAVRELRTAMRITGRVDVLPMLADSERGMGRPERAFDIAASDEADHLDIESTIELMIVVAGAYADTGDVETGLRSLEIPALRQKVAGKWQVRLWVAYADLLERAERADEARRWLTLAADADTDRATDAAERLGRPAPVVVPDPTWFDAEELSVVDVFDDTADDDTENDTENKAGSDGTAESHGNAESDGTVENGGGGDTVAGDTASGDPATGGDAHGQVPAPPVAAAVSAEAAEPVEERRPA